MNFSITDLTKNIIPPETFSDISYDLLNEVVMNIDKVLLQEFIKALKTNEHTDLVITGNIGVGKSTICQLLSSLLSFVDNKIKINTYPEYIRLKVDKVKDVGELMLQLRSDKQISVETFQHFILDFWYMILSAKDYKSKHLSLYERLPEDSLYCFAKRSYENKEISEDGWMRLQRRYNEIKQDFNIFEKKDCVTFRVNNESSLVNTLSEIMKIVIEQTKNKHSKADGFVDVKPNDKLYIILEVKPTIYQQRIKIRNRDSEQSLSTTVLEEYGSFY